MYAQSSSDEETDGTLREMALLQRKWPLYPDVDSSSSSEGEGEGEDSEAIHNNIKRMGDSLRSKHIPGRVTYVEGEETVSPCGSRNARGLLYSNINFRGLQLDSDPWAHNLALQEQLMTGSLHSELKRVTDALMALCMEVQVHGKELPSLSDMQRLLVNCHNCKKVETQDLGSGLLVVEYRMLAGTRLAVVGRSQLWAGYVILPD